MIEQGIVSALNPRSGRFVLELPDGTCVVAELLGTGQVRLGDLLAGEVRLLGQALLKRADAGLEVDAFVLAYEVSRQAAEFEIA
jgi:hypothetical protein